MQILGLVIAFAIIVVAIGVEEAFAQSYSTTLILDPIPSQVIAGDTIVFSGQLLTADGEYVLTNSMVLIKDNVRFGTDYILDDVVTDENGEFYAEWIATQRDDLGSYDFYAKYEGESGISPSRSNTYSVFVQGIPTSLTLDPIPQAARIGEIIYFTGSLKLQSGSPEGMTVYIKDEDAFDWDDYLAIATVNSNGRFQASWQVQETESSDRRFTAIALQLFDPSLQGTILLNKFINAAASDTVEIYAAFERTELYSSSKSCNDPCNDNVITILDCNALTKETVTSILKEGISGGTTKEFLNIAKSYVSNNDLRYCSDVIQEVLTQEIGLIDTSEITTSKIVEFIDEPKQIEPAREVISWPPEQTQQVTTTVRSDTRIPDWVKNNADWWASGKLSDSDFTNGIEYLIENDIIVISDLPQSTGNSNEKIPDWVRFNASWWATGLITEDDFIKGIQFLVEQGIIRV